MLVKDFLFVCPIWQRWLCQDYRLVRGYRLGGGYRIGRGCSTVFRGVGEGSFGRQVDAQASIQAQGLGDASQEFWLVQAEVVNLGSDHIYPWQWPLRPSVNLFA